jgi:hypothetical protein
LAVTQQELVHFLRKEKVDHRPMEAEQDISQAHPVDGALEEEGPFTLLAEAVVGTAEAVPALFAAEAAEVVTPILPEHTMLSTIKGCAMDTV